jgi:type IV pilus assembly protein PilY1
MNSYFNTIIEKCRLKAAPGAVLLALLSLMVMAPAQAVTLGNSPLFLNTAVDANVFFEVDDSGSMDWEILTTQQWHACAYRNDAYCDGSPGYLVTNGQWRAYGGTVTETDTSTDPDTVTVSEYFGDFEYIFDNSDNVATNACTSDKESMYACGTDLNTNVPYQFDWRVLSADFNVMYYDPLQTYSPWQASCDAVGTACGNASFNAARSNPRDGEAGYTVLRDLDGFRYETWIDDRGFAGASPQAGAAVNANATPNGLVDLWDGHTTYTVSGTDIIETTVLYAPDNSGLNPVIGAPVTYAATDTLCHGGGSVCRTAADELQNIANWYQYARKRAFVTKGGLATVIQNHPEFRYGLSVINEHASLFVEVPPAAADYSAHNASLLDAMITLDWADAGTPLRQGLERAGNYFDNTDGRTDPIIDSCQKNFAVLFTDGYWNGADPGAAIGNADADANPLTLADVAKHYYDTDLSPLVNNVAPDANSNDLATHQHLVTYGVAFGVEGNLTDTNGDGWPDPALAEGDDWGNPFCSDCPEKIDDLWHAAYNSRGAFISARTPAAVASSLEAALQNIEGRTKSASSAAASTGHLRSDTLLFQAQFVAADWHGKLLAFGVSTTDGSVIVPAKMDASQRLPAPNSRTILTVDPDTGSAVPFSWASFTAGGTLQTALNKNALGTPDGLGEQRLEYLRGDASNENDSSGFRERPTSKLGDIVNSGPVYVGKPHFRYPDNWGTGEPESCSGCEYSAFKSAKSSREPIVYVGANDGMLHGFNAEDAADLMVEKLAYVPSPVYRNLSALTAPGYTHRYYVDGSPTYGDAFYGGAWHSVLVGGLNHGGQGIYALDITDPSGFSESGTGPADTVLWEFTDADDADLGYTYSQPAIVRMQNGDWAAVFGNGYNNTEADGNASTSGHAVLYIVNIEDGSLIEKIDTGVGDTTNPNGLATPAVVDINGDRLVDYIYAGDLRGNLWKFDVNSSSSSSWDVAFKSGANSKPLFIAKDASNNPQPITSRPEVGQGYFSFDIMVYFGTGRYLGGPDVADTSSQSFYAVSDTDSQINSRAGMLEQTITFQGTDPAFPNERLRTLSHDPLTKTHTGWFLDLPDSGERVASNPLLIDNRVIFVTIVPDSGTCSSGGYSWLMEINAENGGALADPPFDLNNDGVFDLRDMIDTDADGIGDTSPAGIRPGKGISPAPVRLMDVDKEHKYMPSSSGEIAHVVENPGSGFVGRQSWRQIR